ncbi:Glycosyltransferase involved in cell wall bisynthesis [Flavobacterium micromati]|uniref:Glycosyltransferase involved in cell wall bisynthesis n=1 Tax=Flavobacterium micromati TaxID=229205 RepID=A0A1M5H676_9FLAO|nr:glycosyltransferase family A protein [Flavobacterium micromati]SHG11509.1 Glycosyltransferase involved in cell wall bisynthesis [Flavobacterium micromati]
MIVTIIMATYNRAHFIAEMLRSIQKQSFSNWECLIIDDGGTDNTLEIITPILNDDSRFSYHSRTANYQKGLPGTRNYGLDLAKGEYIIFFDDDDIIHPDNLKIVVSVIKSNNADFCHYQKHSFQNIRPDMATTQIIVEGNINKDAIKKVITQEIGLASCTVLWTKECFANIRFNESLMYAEEWECYIRIISENFKGVIISNVLYYNRKHSNSNTAEFYTNSPIRRESYTEAILLVTQNLKEKRLLTAALKRYFITLSIEFTEYNLFEKILKILDLPTFEKIKWKLFYVTLPLRLYVYRIKKRGL